PLESTIRFRRYLTRNPVNETDVKAKMTATVGDDEAIRARRRGVLERPSVAIGEEGPCDIGAQVMLLFTSLRSLRTPLGVEGAFELMIPCRFSEQLVERGWRIVLGKDDPCEQHDGSHRAQIVAEA